MELLVQAASVKSVSRVHSHPFRTSVLFLSGSAQFAQWTAATSRRIACTNVTPRAEWAPDLGAS